MLAHFRIKDVLTDDDCKTLADFLGYPRAGARRHGGIWSRYHKLKTADRLRVSLQQSLPIAAAYFRFVDHATHYSYEPLMKWGVLDFDAATPVQDEMMRELIRQIWEQWRLVGIQPCLTHSGSKGWHLWVFLDQEVDPGYFRGLFRNTLLALGSLTQDSGKWHHPSFWDSTGGKDGRGAWAAEVDPLVKGGNGKGGIVKLPFSQHQKRQDRWEFPVARQQLDEFSPVDNPSPDDWAEAVRTFRDEWKLTKAELVTDNFPCLSEISSRGRPAKHKKSGPISSKRLPMFQIPAPGTATRQDEIDNLYQNIPCLKNATDKSASKEVRYDLRTPVVQILAAYGYTREEISAWIRDNINDAEDNLNPGMMIDQVNHWHQYDYLAKCASYTNPSYASFCCPGFCGRKAPTELNPSVRTLLQIPPETGHTLSHELSLSRERRYHMQLFKSTRIGATTGVVLDALRAGERLLVVVPTTAIATSTIQKALEIYSKEPGAVPRYAVSLVDTRKGCLMRAMDVDSQRRTWDNETPALNLLDHVSKPSCATCRFNPGYNSNARYLDREPFVLMHESDLTNYRCQLISAMDTMQKWDIVVITAAKLRAMELSQWDNQWGNETWVTWVKRWATSCRMVFLDEVSTYTDAPDLKVLVHRVPLEGGAYDLDVVLEDQVRQLDHYKPDLTTAGIKLIVDDLTDELRPYRDTEGVVVYDRPVTLAELEQIQKDVRIYQKRIETYALHTNIALVPLFRSLTLATEMQWLIVNEPDADAQRCLSVYVAPKFPDVFKTFVQAIPARVIASDATMPLFNLGTVLGVDFEQVNVGDPMATSELQKIVPFQISIPSPNIDTYLDWVVEFLVLGQELFGKDEFTIAVPSKKIHRLLKGEKELRDMDTMWHRSSESLGVENDNRVMFGIGAPYEPSRAEHWKKVAFPGLFTHMEEEEMWEYEMHKTLFQTLSRPKDPASIVRSVYIAFGHTASELEDMRINVVRSPDVVPLAACKGRTEMIAIPLLTGWFWKTHGELLSRADQHAVFELWTGVPVTAVPPERATDLQALMPGRITGIRCVRCGHQWSPRSPDPRQCPSCNSRNFC